MNEQLDRHDMNDGKKITVFFNPGHGICSLRSLKVTPGETPSAFPIAERRGYTFLGWKTAQGKAVTPADVADLREDTVLFAEWKRGAERARADSAARRVIAAGRLRTQRIALIAICCVLLVLAIALIVVMQFRDMRVYRDADPDQTTYYVKKNEAGVYALYDKDGNLCDKNAQFGYYITAYGTQLDIDGEKGTWQIAALLDTADGEILGTATRVLMYPQMTYDNTSTSDKARLIEKIEVTNQYGSYAFVRNEGEDNNRFHIEGYENTAFSENLFAALSSSTGYTLTAGRLEHPKTLPDGAIDYAEYGLVSQRRTRLDDEGNTEGYDYVPASFAVTNEAGQRFCVTVGDIALSKDAYYAKLEGRDRVYLLTASVTISADYVYGIGETVLQPIESYVTPLLSYPTSLNDYYDVSHFQVRTDIDYKEVLLKITEQFGESIEEEEMDDYTAAFDALMTQYSTLMCDATFVPLSERQETMEAYSPYKNGVEMLAGYALNDGNIDSALLGLMNMKVLNVTRLSPSVEELAAAGVLMPAHVISYFQNVTVDGKTLKVPNYLSVSALTENATYFAYSPYYDVLVEVDKSQFYYLDEWTAADWYLPDYLTGSDINYVKEIKLETPEKTLDFTLSTNGEDLIVYADGKRLDYAILLPNVVGTVEQKSGVDNFRRFYRTLLYASIEGVLELSEEELAQMRERPDAECQLILTMICEDGSGNHRYAKYRYYRVGGEGNGRKSYLTVELLASPDGASDATNAKGIFYVLSPYVERIISDAYKVVNQEAVDY